MSWDRIDSVIERLFAGAAAVGRVVPRVLADPRAYPRESMLLAAIAALLLLLVVLLGMALFDAAQGWARRRRMGVRVRRVGWRRRAAIALGVLCVLLVVLALAPMAPMTGRACGACHRMSEATASWRQGDHAQSACYGCHAAPGITGAFEAGARGAGRLLASSDTTGAVVDSRSCLGCHDDLERGTIGRDLLVRHAEIIEAGMACTDCHPTVGHKDATESGSAIARSVMSRCLLCHDGSKASSACKTCHATGPLDSAVASGSGSSRSLVTCKGCHSAAVDANCIRCHGLELPHNLTFFRSHAARSAADPALCAKCHETASASQTCACHSEPNVHGTYDSWYPQHGVQANAMGPGGCMCHDNRGYAFCGKCHDSSPW